MTLDAWRRSRSMTLRQLASLLGLGGSNPERTVQRYLAGERIPGRAMIRLIGEVTDGAVTDSDWPIRPTRTSHVPGAAFGQVIDVTADAARPGGRAA
jgi:transcriptional regulator with XRE-family HTH domain